MNDAQSKAWVALVEAADLLPAVLDAHLTASSGLISFEYGILSILYVAEGQEVSMKALGAAVDSPAPRLSKAVTRLEKRGFVERRRCPGDGRAILVRLTRQGRKVWLNVTPGHITLARDTLLADYNDAQLEELAVLLGPLLRRLDPDARRDRVESLHFDAKATKTLDRTADLAEPNA